MKIAITTLSLVCGWLCAVVYLFLMASRDFAVIPHLFGITAPVGIILFVSLLFWTTVGRRKSPATGVFILSIIGLAVAYLEIWGTWQADVGLPFMGSIIFSLWGAIFGLVTALVFHGLYSRTNEPKNHSVRHF